MKPIPFESHLGCIALAVLLAGCASAPARLPDLTSGVVTADKPLALRCIKAEKIPAEPIPPAIAPDADIEQRATWALIRDVQLRQHVVQLRAVLIACTTIGD